jgi:hypothetical protein
MKQYSLHLVTVIFLVAGIASCKKETAMPEENIFKNRTVCTVSYQTILRKSINPPFGVKFLYLSFNLKKLFHGASVRLCIITGSLKSFSRQSCFIADKNL